MKNVSNYCGERQQTLWRMSANGLENVRTVCCTACQPTLWRMMLHKGKYRYGLYVGKTWLAIEQVLLTTHMQHSILYTVTNIKSNVGLNIAIN